MRRSRTRIGRLALGVFALAMAALCRTPARAEDGAPHRPRIEAWGGLFFNKTDTAFRTASDLLGTGTLIDGEEDLGLAPSGTTWAVNLALRLGKNKRHMLEGRYFALKREAQTTLQRTIQFGDEIVPVFAAAQSHYAADIFRAHYSYMVSTGRRHELGLALGLVASDVDVALEVPVLGIDEDEGLPLPVPTVGLRAQGHLAPRLRLRASTDVFVLPVRDIDGTLIDSFVGLELDLTHRLGLGAGYTFVDIDVDSSLDGYSGSLEVTYRGLMSYIKVMM